VSPGIPLAWLQLAHEKLRFLAAAAGITFAVVLMLMQLGFEDALLSSVGQVFERLRCDIALMSPEYEFILAPKGFSERRLDQALAIDGVASCASVYLGQGPLKNPADHSERNLLIMGFRPRTGVVELPGVDDRVELLRNEFAALFDAKSRLEFGPIAQEVRAGRRVATEVAGRRVDIVGLFSLGTSFGVDGTLLVSDENFLRILPYRKRGIVNIGLIGLKTGFDPVEVRSRISAALPKDVLVLTHQQMVDKELAYWTRNTPIGFVFKLGLIMGLIVGSIIVYQVLYTDVSDHLGEYATLKAMGYHDRYLFSVVIQESVILSVFGFVPGIGLSLLLYSVAARATLIPIHLTATRGAAVYALTLCMCILSGVLAMRRLKHADPAEIF
jgi:putative ABC transport system permease protein